MIRRFEVAKWLAGVVIGAIIVGGSLGGCVSSGSAPAQPVASQGAVPQQQSSGWFGGLFGGGKQEQVDPKLVKQFLNAGHECPDVTVRDGTQFQPILGKGAKGAQTLRFQAVIRAFSRNCEDQAGNTLVHVGVGGYLIAGPQGGSGSVDLPIRVAVVKDGHDVVYSKQVPARATITEPESQARWTANVDDIVIPGDGSDAFYQIYVGFDDVSMPGAKSPHKPKKGKK